MLISPDNNVTILKRSLNLATGDILTTVVFNRFPKCLLAQLDKHRVFSSGSSSARAIPVKRVFKKIEADMYIPYWTLNQRGMVGAEGITQEQVEEATKNWKAAYEAIKPFVENLERIGVHKQEVNRLLETFTRVPVIISSTTWSNFFKLRNHPTAQPDFQADVALLEKMMKDAPCQELQPGEWHLVFDDPDRDVEDNLKVGSARSARISYETHDGDINPERDYELHDQLKEDMHLVPFEHSAKALPVKDCPGNFTSFIQYRYYVENDIPVKAVENKAPAKVYDAYMREVAVQNTFNRNEYNQNLYGREQRKNS